MTSRYAPGITVARKLASFATLALVCMPSDLWAQTTTWNTNGSSIWYAPSGTNVGIGTPSPSAPLHIYSTSPILARFQINNGGVANRFTELGYDGLNARLGTDGSLTNLYFQGGAVAVTGSGNVGIGTTNPGNYRLAVEGTIGARDVIVTTLPWSDYVFRPGYRLRPLSEVGQYIEANGHLPDIPTEAEVKEKGVSLGDMQAKLLAKVEELTLHMIQQDKENRELREHMTRQAKENRDLRQRLARLEQSAAADSTAVAAK